MSAKGLEKEMALSRIERLYELASRRVASGTEKDKALARRYMRIAKELSEHYRITFPRRVKDHICIGCKSVLVPGRNCTVRISSGRVVYRCGECGASMKLQRRVT